MDEVYLDKIYREVEYFRKHRKARIEFYCDANGAQVFAIVKKNHRVKALVRLTDKDLAIIAGRANSKFEKYNVVRKHLRKTDICMPEGFPYVDYTLIYKLENTMYAIEKLNERIKILKTGGIIQL